LDISGFSIATPASEKYTPTANGLPLPATWQFWPLADGIGNAKWSFYQQPENLRLPFAFIHIPIVASKLDRR
jgi:hypothetical protein